MYRRGLKRRGSRGRESQREAARSIIRVLLVRQGQLFQGPDRAEVPTHAHPPPSGGQVDASSAIRPGPPSCEALGADAGQTGQKSLKPTSRRRGRGDRVATTVGDRRGGPECQGPGADRGCRAAEAGDAQRHRGRRSRRRSDRRCRRTSRSFRTARGTRGCPCRGARAVIPGIVKVTS